MPTITPISRTVTPSVTVQNRPATTLTVTPASRPNNPVQITVQSRTVQVSLGSSNAGGQSFTHTQSTPLTEWSVTHPFGSVPASLLLLNASGKYMIPDTAEVSAERVVLLFGTPTAGTLRLTKG